MRIIAGKYKGHQLVAFQADHIRPTTDRVKETLFNKIQFKIEDSSVLDLFCGTGNLGIEALSRGAKFCTFVEKNPKSLEITRKNFEKLKVPKTDYKVVNRDVLAFLREYEGEAFGVILVDPPFTQKMAHDVMLAMAKSPAAGEASVIAIESQGKERMESEYGDLVRYAKKEYGDKILSLFCHRNAIEADEE